MSLLTLPGISRGEQRVLSAVRTEVPPEIDGVIEAVWARADSATGFIQMAPDEGKPSTERTVVYLLYDDQSLYIAFKCFDSEPEKLVLRVTPRDQGGSSNDNVGIILDTFNNKTTGYGFVVNAKGVQSDGYFSSDGRSKDPSWDGVWYSAARVTDFGYVVEMKIPFRSIRFKRDLSVWGINFFREISRKREWVFWTPQKRNEGLRISGSGQLIGIHPGQIGLHLEVYPVALTRYEKSSGSLHTGLNLSWFPTSSSSLHLTVNPDFAQVEADPYRVNLSKYELYLSERRPFFVEGANLFNCLGGMPHLFYSRRIGKRLPGGKEVPILAASKLTARPGRFEIGTLGAVTGQVEYSEDDSVCTEPQSWFSVLRVKRRFLKNSELGLLYAGKEGDGFNRVEALDGELRTGGLRFGFVTAHSDKKGRKGAYGGKIDFSWTAKNLRLGGYIQNISSRFDIDQIGFFPWVGRKELGIWGGPVFYNQGPFKQISLFFNGWCQREFAEPYPEYSLSSGFNLNFVNNWGCHFGSGTGKRYEEGERYSRWHTSFWMWSDWAKRFSASSGFWYNSRSYNYSRKYFAPNGGAGLNLRWQINPGLRLNLSANNATEFKPNGAIKKLNWISHLTLQYALDKDLHLRVWLEPNFATDIHRVSILLSWNFRPKSWVYLAFNESRNNAEGKMKLENRIAVFKVRYLFFL